MGGVPNYFYLLLRIFMCLTGCPGGATAEVRSASGVAMETGRAMGARVCGGAIVPESLCVSEEDGEETEELYAE